MNFLSINFIVLFGAYMLVEPYWVQEKHDVFYDEDVPAAFNDFKIIFISDIHHGPYLNRNRVARLVDRVNDMEGDVILLGGDYVHRNERYIEPCFEELKRLNSKYGVYGVLGNHDHWEGAQLTREAMTNSGINIVDNKSYWLNLGQSRIKIGGVGDLWEDKQLIDSTIQDVEISDFVILISHSPDYAEILKTDKVDLMLAGHTHGGQVSLFGLWAPVVPSKYGQKYRTGIVKTEHTTVLVSNGIGTITPPIRFFTRPQINLITLKRPDNSE